MVGGIVLGVLGTIFCIMGYLIWAKKKISLLHDYHRDKVTEENIAPFCRLAGLGMIVVGAGILATAVILGVTDSAWSFLAFVAGFVPGLALMIHAVSKYNR